MRIKRNLNNLGVYYYGFVDKQERDIRICVEDLWISQLKKH